MKKIIAILVFTAITFTGFSQEEQPQEKQEEQPEEQPEEQKEE